MNLLNDNILKKIVVLYEIYSEN